MLDPEKQKPKQDTKLPSGKRGDEHRGQHSNLAGNYKVTQCDFKLDGVVLTIQNQNSKSYNVTLVTDAKGKKEYSIQAENQKPTKVSVGAVRQIKLPKVKSTEKVTSKSLTPEPNGEDLVKYLDILHRSEAAEVERIAIRVRSGLSNAKDSEL